MVPARRRFSPSTAISIGQLPAASMSKTASEARAVAAVVPLMATGRRTRQPRRGPTRQPTPNDDHTERGGDGEQRQRATRRGVVDGAARRCRDAARKLRRRPGRDQELVDAKQPLALPAPAGSSLPDELVEAGPVGHRSSPSSASASRASALRVRVLTVPSGIRASRRPRSARARSSTRARSPDARARAGPRVRGALATLSMRPRPSEGRGRPRSILELRDGSVCAAARRRLRCARPRTARARRSAPGSYVRADRQIATNASCVASSARPRSPSRRRASPSTGRA